MKKIKPDSRTYKRRENEIKETYAPPIAVCKNCGSPRHAHYICQYCGKE
jgi:ribosomal protein L32